MDHRVWSRAQQTFSVKDQRVNIFGFERYVVSAATTESCCCSMKALIEWVQLCAHNTLFTESGDEPNLALGTPEEGNR